MDFDEYDYLEKAVEVTESPDDAEDKDRRRSKHDDGHRSKKDDSTDRRRSHDRSRQDDRSKKTRVSDDGADRPDRERERGERGRREERREEHERPSHDRGHARERTYFEKGVDRERPGRDTRDRDRRDHGRTGGWHNGGGWGRGGGRDRFFGRNRDFDHGHFGGKTREREDRHFERFPDKEDKPSDVENEHGGSRYSREKKEKKEDGTTIEPEVDPERDQRTVFAFQISLKADERDVYDFFSKAGKVRDVRLIMDRNLRRSKGVGYVEFYDAMSVPMAIAMTGQLLLGQPVMVKPSEAEKNLVQSTATTGAGAMGPYTGGARRLYVGNLHYNITDIQLRQVFEPFGTVEFVQLPTEPETGQSKGYAFIQFARLEDARSAQTSLNGNLHLAGRVIKVLAVTEQMNMQEPGLVSGELDDDEGGGLTLTAQSRTLLMQKLDRSGTSTSVTPSHSAQFGNLPSSTNIAMNTPTSHVGSSLLPGVIGLSNTGLAASAAAASIGSPTECILLKNMFDPATETDAEFDLDIKDEVMQECSKFGAVKHIYVDKMSAGHVYLRFDMVSAATGAQRALHARWFAGKMITVSFLTIREYELKFPESA
ncbi:hypothetical protein GOP47_0028209 [Adiantum capillus-veneris]|nr:hypothetical protein GOP47_0028209 [Adiantum capillus-veneris]